MTESTPPKPAHDPDPQASEWKDSHTGTSHPKDPDTSSPETPEQTFRLPRKDILRGRESFQKLFRSSSSIRTAHLQARFRRTHDSHIPNSRAHGSNTPNSRAHDSHIPNPRAHDSGTLDSGTQTSNLPNERADISLPSEQRATKEAVLLTAFIAPKRVFPKAVDRNKIKRWLREAFRKNRYLLQSQIEHSTDGIHLALIANRSPGNYQTVESEVVELLQSIARKLSGTSDTRNSVPNQTT